MIMETVVKAFEKKGYVISCFDTRQQAVDYLKESIRGKTVGFGGSQTLTELDLRHVLAEGSLIGRFARE